MKNGIVAAFLAVGIALIAGVAPSYAQTTYAVKFVCGTQPPAPPGFRVPEEPPVKPGNYATVINVQGLFQSDLVSETTITSKISLAGASGPAQTGPTLTLKRFQTGDITCLDIADALPSPISPFITGYLNLQTAHTIAVTAVYTSQGCHFPLASVQPFQACTGPTSIEVVPQQPLPPIS
jgi:hypothetical protein